MQLAVNACLGAFVALGLYLIGVPNAVLWGIAAAALRFVPYVGVWIAAIVPIGLSLAISDNWLAPLLTFGLFVVLELAVSNVLEPWLYGKHTGVSPVAVSVAAVAWTWLWGIAGLLLATPLTVCLLVIGKHVPQLSFLTILLGDEPVFETEDARLPAVAGRRSRRSRGIAGRAARARASRANLRYRADPRTRFDGNSLASWGIERRPACFHLSKCEGDH